MHMSAVVSMRRLTHSHKLLNTPLRQGYYRVRARDARIRVMRGQHQNCSIKNEAIEPPTISIITRYSSGVVN
jgi:hypothetical protein